MNKITSQWEDITPTIAMKYIDSMDGNRTVRQARVDYYAGQMKAGLWRPTHQGIAFDTNDHMIDGQHRMWAIVESGVTVTIKVDRGVHPDDVTAVDNGLARDYQDIAHYAGWETNPMTATIAKMLVLGVGRRHIMVPPQVLNQWYEHYKEAIDFAVSLRNHCRASTKVMTTCMTGAFARAWYSVDHGILSRMGEVLKTGITVHDADRAALTLRDAWLTKRLGTLESEQYAKTTAAIRAFAARRPITKLQAAEKELFVIPKLPFALRYEKVNSHESPRSGKAVRQAKATATA